MSIKVYNSLLIKRAQAAEACWPGQLGLIIAIIVLQVHEWTVSLDVLKHSFDLFDAFRLVCTELLTVAVVVVGVEEGQVKVSGGGGEEGVPGLGRHVSQVVGLSRVVLLPPHWTGVRVVLVTGICLVHVSQVDSGVQRCSLMPTKNRG